MEDQFLTLKSSTEGYYMERGSKFLAYAYPVQTEEQVHQFLLQLRKAHPKARHFCSAIRLKPDASLERSSDDGEPSGSAGRPILGQLVKNHLTNVCVIVVRYFGGTKLGVPGLIEAYKTSTSNALTSALFMEQTVYTKVVVKLSYETFPHFLNHCKQNNIPVFEEIFGDQATLVTGFKKSSRLGQLLHELQQYSQMDFQTLDEYAAHLNMEFDLLTDEVIL